MGYGLSSPDDVPTEIQRKEVRVKEKIYSRHEPEVDFNVDFYKHPDKAAKPARRFRHSYDIYSMGLVLLEIGLWQSLQKFESETWTDAYAFRRFVLERLVPDLWGQCGSIYGGVVKDYLTMSTDISLEDEEGRRLA